MIYYSSGNNYILKLIDNFCKKIDSKKVNILESKYSISIKDKDNIFFIPIYGEEELNIEWEKFLKRYAKNPQNIGINTFFYLYGIYDLEIDKNTTIIKQINNILKFLSSEINIFPLKIISDYTPIEALVYYYNHTNIRNKNINFLINRVIFFSKQELLQNSFKIVDFTSKVDEYSSVLDTIKLKKKRKFITKVVSSLTSESVILNRVKNVNMDKVLKKVKNSKIIKLQLKSNRLKNIKSLSGFSSLEVLNITANYFNKIDIDSLSDTIKSLNISKNSIERVKIKQIRPKVKKLILFNNRIVDMSFLSKFPNLEYLNIGLNPIKEFPDTVLNLKKIKHLNISYIDIDYLPNKILKLKELKTLDITGSKILYSSDIIPKLQKNGVKVIS
jgi:hypothetical protein